MTFAAVAPTLTELQFSGSMENLNVATVLEMRRGGPWLVPTLEGEARIAKPPLAAWVTALFVRPSTVHALDTRNSAAREAAYQELAWEVRWAPLAGACLALMAVFSMVSTIGGTRVGLVATAICASSLYFLRFARQSTTDTELFIWVAVANAFLARMVLDEITFANAIGAGAAVGLAFMSKGPVALLQTVVPAVAFAAWKGWLRRHPDDRPAAPRRGRFVALLAGVAVMLVVGMSWYGWVRLRIPDALVLWQSEINGERTVAGRAGNPLSYLSLFSNMAPWTLFFAHGVGLTLIDVWWAARLKWVRWMQWLGPGRRPDSARERWAWPLFFVLIPLLVMVCFPQREERYLLPLAPSAAALAARSLMLTLGGVKRTVPMWLHWWVLLVGALVILIGGSFPVLHTHGQWQPLLRAADGTPWFTPTVAIPVAILIVGIIAGSAWATWIRRGWAVAGTVVVMLILQGFYVGGFASSRSGLSPMKPLADRIWQTAPNALLYNTRADGEHKRASVDLSIYLDRSTLWVDDLQHLPEEKRPLVCVMPHDPKSPLPAPPAGWRLIERVPRFDDEYLAYERDKSAQ